MFYSFLETLLQAKKSFETKKDRNIHHQRLQFQHTSESTWVPREDFICDCDTP